MRSIQRYKIKPGAIFHAHCHFIDPPKPKYFVIAHVDPDDDLILMFLINKRDRQDILNNPEDNNCQVIVHEKDYEFLYVDSYLDCSEVIDEMEYSDLAKHIEMNPGDYWEELTPKDKKDMLRKVKNGERQKLCVNGWLKSFGPAIIKANGKLVED